MIKIASTELLNRLSHRMLELRNWLVRKFRMICFKPRIKVKRTAREYEIIADIGNRQFIRWKKMHRYVITPRKTYRRVYGLSLHPE